MDEATAIPKRPVRGRPARQVRSAETRRRISDAAIRILAERGITGVTHRRVADCAGVPLSATTYYYATKFDLLAEASNAILRGYVEAFARAVERYSRPGGPASTFGDFAVRLVRNATGAHRQGTIAWAEITLDAVRHPESLVLAQKWASEIDRLWRGIAEALDVAEPAAAARSGVDMVMGLLLMAVSLGLEARQVEAVLVRGEDPLRVWAVPALPEERADRMPSRPKAAQTRRRILESAIGIMISDGPAAVTYRLIAERAGLTAAAPSYHFRTINDLLRAAQVALFEDSKARYRNASAAAGEERVDLGYVVDLTATVFQREATEDGPRNLATYATWLEAARRAELRPLVWSAIEDQCRAWQRLLSSFGGRVSPVDGLLAQALFVGKLVRVLSTGSQMKDLVGIRREFTHDLTAIAAGTFWLEPGIRTDVQNG